MIKTRLLKVIKKFLDVVILDDIKFVRYAIKRRQEGQNVLDPEKVAAFKGQFINFNVGVFFRDNWTWILAVLFAGVCGYLIGVQYCTVHANNYIVSFIKNYTQMNAPALNHNLTYLIP